MVEDEEIKTTVSPFAMREGEIKTFDGKDGYVSINQIINNSIDSDRFSQILIQRLLINITSIDEGYELGESVDFFWIKIANWDPIYPRLEGETEGGQWIYENNTFTYNKVGAFYRPDEKTIVMSKFQKNEIQIHLFICNSTFFDTSI